MKKARIMLADDHAIVLRGLQKLLESEFDIVGAVHGGRELLGAAAKLKPDLILLDVSMPDLNGIEAARRLKEIVPATKIVFLTMHAEPVYVREALNEGAAGYLVKSSSPTELIHAIHEALEGRLYITSQVLKETMSWQVKGSSEASPKDQGLTPRQREVLQLVADGRTTKEIAAILNLSIRTVDFHKSAIMEKLGIRSTAELIKYAIENRLNPS